MILLKFPELPRNNGAPTSLPQGLGVAITCTAHSEASTSDTVGRYLGRLDPKGPNGKLPKTSDAPNVKFDTM